MFKKIRIQTAENGGFDLTATVWYGHGFGQTRKLFRRRKKLNENSLILFTPVFYTSSLFAFFYSIFTLQPSHVPPTTTQYYIYKYGLKKIIKEIHLCWNVITFDDTYSIYYMYFKYILWFHEIKYFLRINIELNSR